MLQRLQWFVQTSTLLEEYQLIHKGMKNILAMSTKILKTIIFNDPVIFLLGIYHKEIIRNLNEDLHKFDVKFKHYFQYKKRYL